MSNGDMEKNEDNVEQGVWRSVGELLFYFFFKL